MAAEPTGTAQDGDGPRCRSVAVDGLHAIVAALDADDLRLAYEVVCNATLWYLHHDLYSRATEPVFGPAWFEAWDAYRRINAGFADLVGRVAPEGAAVLVQDYHLALVGPMLAERRDDLATVHFSHTPFARPSTLAMLPDPVRRELLGGLAGHGACGFHTARWRDAFLACCAADGIDAPRSFVAPLGPDPDDLAATASSAAFADASDRLAETVGDRLLIARSDRIELSKNLIRGFQAFDVLLERHPRWREQVMFAASVYPSRESNPDYLAYRNDMERVVAEIDARWATAAWSPILLDTGDHYPSSMAALARADVVLVNPISDGLNLVAKEAMLINHRDALLALSAQAGAWDELGDAAARVHPYDLVQTADVLDELLGATPEQRARSATRLRALAGARTPADWLEDQIDQAR